MRKLFDIKRTKMIDELAFEHNPMSFGKTFLAFFILTLISSVATNSVTNAPIMINFIITEFKNGTFESLTDTLIKFMESPYVSIPWWVILIQLFGGIFAIIAVTVYMKKFEKRKMRSIGLRRGAQLEIILGALIGTLLIGVMFASTLFSGAISYTFAGIDLRILLFALGFAVFSFGEELLVRGFFMNMLARDIKPMAAILTSAILSAIAGFSVYNIPSFINTVLFGILLGIYVFKRGSIWGAVAIRFVWSFVGASILGTNVFDTYAVLSVFVPKYNASSLIGGSSTQGFEAGLIMTVILAVAILLSLLLKTKRSEESFVKIDYFK